MTKLKRRLIARDVTLALCGLLILISSFVISNKGILAVAQAQRKSISRGIVVRNIEQDPVRITTIKVGAAARHFEEQFDESDDWLKKLSFEIENKTSKPIVYLLVSLDFPETRSSGNEMRFYVYLGNDPGLPPKREDIYVAPNEKLVVGMADRFEWLSQFLQTRHSINQINKVEIRVTRAVFDDKTAWGGGEFFVQDPNKPGRYIPVTAKPLVQ